MKKYTVDEKVKYNEKKYKELEASSIQNDQTREQASFSSGYTLGVSLYRDYVKTDKEGRAIIDQLIASSKVAAKLGDKGCKGIMCGMRDAANERKAKNKR